MRFNWDLLCIQIQQRNQLSTKQNVILDVKNILGETIRKVVSDELEGGLHEIMLPALPKGIYMIDLYTGNKHHVRRLIVS